MRVTEQILRALNTAEARNVEDAGRALGYYPARKARGTRKTIRVLLLAAAFALLFGATAYALGWFGLSSRLTEAEDTSPFAAETPVQGKQTETALPVTHYLSFNDYAGTPAAKAHAEWNVFWWDYVGSHSFDNAAESEWKQQLDAEMSAIADIYGCGNAAMLDKLLEIRDRYGVHLHTASVFPGNDERFFELTGLKPFFLGEGEIQVQYLYEDGSFKAEGQAALEGLGYPFTLVRGAKGALDPAANREDRAEDYEEWGVSNDRGQTVGIALGPEPVSGEEPGMRFCYLFYDSPEYLVTVMGSVPAGEKAKAYAEELADRFDFALLASGKTDLSPVTQAKPREVKPKEGLMTLADWVATDEYKASSEFRSAVCAWADGLDEYKGNYRGLSIYNYYGSFPPRIPELRTAAEEIEANYGLEMPHDVRAVLAGSEVDPSRVTPDLGYRSEKEDTTSLPVLSEEECWALLGVEPFTAAGKPFHMFRYDTGAFFCNLNLSGYTCDVHYIPKGTFYPLFRFVLHPDLTGWAYDTACGEQVYLVHGGDMEYPHAGIPYVLYESDLGYVIVEIYSNDDAYTLQAVADDIDFTKFP